MPSPQDRIFQDGPELETKPATQNKFHRSQIAAPLKAVFQVLKNTAMLGTALMFLWGMGEEFLPHDFRLTTFLGRRVVNLGNIENAGTAKTAAQKAAITAAEQGAVQLIQNCETQKNNAGQQAFTECMSQPRALITGCEYRRDQVLKAMNCSHYTAKQLSPTTYNQLP